MPLGETGAGLGFFAALYRRVTIEVKRGIDSGRFEDGNRMDRLDVIFATRYLEALERFRRGEHPGDCWSVAFRSAGRWRLLVLQHLLLGMNGPHQPGPRNRRGTDLPGRSVASSQT